MTERRVVLHIGMEKTGTTAIQGLLSSNREALAEQGFLYSRIPDRTNHTALAAYAIDADVPRDFHRRHRVTLDQQSAFRERIRSHLSAELDTGGIVILSNEHLSSRAVTEADVGRVAELMHSAGAAPRIVLYLRRLVPLIEASYSTFVKSGRTTAFDVDSELERRDRYDLHALVERWDRAFPGQVTVRIYREEFKRDASAIFRDALGAMGGTFTDAFTLPERHANISLSRAATELGRLVNAAAAVADAPLDRRLRLRYMREAERGTVGPPFRLDATQIASVDEAYRDSLEALRSRIGNDAVDYLRAGERADVVPADVSDEERVSAVGALLRATLAVADELTEAHAEELAQRMDEELRESRAECERLRAELLVMQRRADEDLESLARAGRELTITRAAATELQRITATRTWRWSAPARRFVAVLRRRH